ncbi:odorant receptor 107 [Tribolium castaneum]|uniref:Odorant receptor n=1 Tax=Tribolium castaneum TaxID=7070 RepID=D6WV55_TRICA|nr:odorant receptor 107 [Tribolium castaneum]
MENPLKLLHIIGLDPRQSDKYSTIKKVISFLIVLAVLLSALIEFFLHHNESQVYDTAPQSTVPNLQALLKMFALIIYKKELIDLFTKGNHFWKLDKFGDCHKQKLTKLHKYVDLFFYVYAVIITGAFLQLALLILIFEPGKPIFLCYGGLYGLESPQFEFYAVLDFLAIGVIAISVTAYDSIFFYFALYIYTEFKMIKIAFKRENCAQFIEAVKHHDFLLQYISKVNEVFSVIFLTQFFSGLLGICFNLFMISTQGTRDMKSFSTYFVGLVGYTAQSFTFCLIGELISELSEDISNEIFYTDWLDDEVYRNTTARLIVMNRAQESPKLTIGKFADMNLRTFIIILRNAYSFLAFINEVLD